MNRKNILIVTGIYPPQIGGPATYAALLYKELKLRGYSVSVASFGYFLKYPKIFRHICFFVYVLYLSLRNRFDTMFIQDTVSAGLSAVLISKILNVKTVLRVPGDYAWEQGVQRFGIKVGIDDFQNLQLSGILNMIRKIQNFVARSSDIVVVPSKYFSQVVSKWGINKEDIQVVYNGIESLNCIEYIAHSKESRYRIISAGRLVPWKEFDQLIDVFAIVKKDIPESELIIVGEGPMEHSLRHKIENLGLQSSVVILPKMSREELFGYILGSSVFVLNSSFESFSFQAVECMALGVPIIAHPFGSLPEIIGDAGVFFRSRDAKVMSEDIKGLLMNKEILKSFSDRGKQRADKFTFINTVNDLEKIL